MAKEPDKNKQDLWDQAKVVNEVEHRFGQLYYIYNTLNRLIRKCRPNKASSSDSFMAKNFPQTIHRTVLWTVNSNPFLYSNDRFFDYCRSRRVTPHFKSL